MTADGPIRRARYQILPKSGIHAKRKGREQPWQENQILYWNGGEIPRQSDAYAELLSRAYDALFEVPSFRAALSATGHKRLRHTLGNPHPTQTVLTEQEFCHQLTRLRALLD